MTMPPSPDRPDPDQLRALRRAAALRHHPDRGGDPEVFARVMAQLDPRLPRAAGPDGTGRGEAGRADRTSVRPPPVTVVRTGWARSAGPLRRRGRTVLAVVRQRLPRSVPGARRYGRL
ncbi:hypothetical protein QE364_000975 [Nocardioides zeae]|uniref:Uncharacterized protein n=1 Tax=Nocardioides zeae TaxID=1457234 RepID=A0ACC6IEV9_9ACTN|nr:hypothetical protein [Nocardioides zeae]MDR6174907.1 hypothetical protein [Nocardioides zeae]MDR6209283.1 hypothetical protein [Nocardioides zeae]